MKNWKLIFLLLISLSALCSCGPRQTPPISGLPSAGSADVPGTPQPDGFQPPDSSALLQEEQPPREGLAHSPLTYEWVEKSVAASRPIAVMTPNEHNAQPHYNLSKASILYEANVEGRMTRFLAIYEDWKDLVKIGNIRSLRTYFAYWAFEWDAIIIHTGHPYFVDELMADPNTQTLNESNFPDSGAFYRDTARPRPHNAYADGQTILETAVRKGYPLEYRGLTDTHFRFAGVSVQNTLEQYGQNAKSAVYIDMSGCYPLTRCYFDYNPADGFYYRSQYLSGGTDGPHIDAATGEQLRFKNILVQNIKSRDLGEGYLAFECSDSTEDGWYFTNGKGIHVTWEKSSSYGATKFYDDFGNEIILNTGKTMICVIRKEDNFTFR